ncbi:MAG: cyclic nucleotide-binding domain-containing protein [Rhodoferax sp.]|nr:cyclic nucleotide-binding domain-containing protein [Rhodoferax sp.]
MSQAKKLFAEFHGGIESSLMGFSTSIGPVLLFVGLLGSQSLPAAYWATLITAAAAPLMALALRGHAAILYGTRTASLTTYIAIALQLGAASTGHPDNPVGVLSLQQLTLGLAAASLLFALASTLILLTGLLGLGSIFKMIPSTVTAGIGNGIAMVLVWLAIKQVMQNTWLVAVIAVAMLLLFNIWPIVQVRVKALKHLPGTLLAMGLGLVLASTLEPVIPGTATALSLDAGWISMRLWPDLWNHQLGHLIEVGLPGTLALALIMILETFTAIGVMETRFGLRLDASRQLVALGGSNLVNALLGGVPCTGAPLRSVVSWTAGGRGSPAAVSDIVITCTLVVALGDWLLRLPAGVIAGLFLLQAPMMVDPAFIKRLGEMVRTRRLHRNGAADLGFWITLVISLVGFFGSLIWACFLGIGLSALAVLRRLSKNLTAQWAYMNHYRSRRVRSADESANLARMAHRVGVLHLTGHLFFGNSARLTQLLDELHEDAVAVVIDVSQVRDVDPSGLTALTWVVRTLVERPLNVVLTGLRRTGSPELREHLSGLAGTTQRVDLDHGLEFCEELVLQNSTVQSHTLHTVAIEKNQLLQDLSEEDITAVLMLGERREIAKGDVLFERDALADGVWLLEQGAVSILAGTSLAGASRLATFGPGQFVGEMGYVDGKVRSATARADSVVRALLLDKAAIATLIERQPTAALTITRNIARELSQRVRNTSARLTDESTEAAAGWSNSSLSSLSR